MPHVDTLKYKICEVKCCEVTFCCLKTLQALSWKYCLAHRKWCSSCFQPQQRFVWRKQRKSWVVCTSDEKEIDTDISTGKACLQEAPALSGLWDDLNTTDKAKTENRKREGDRWNVTHIQTVQESSWWGRSLNFPRFAPLLLSPSGYMSVKRAELIFNARVPYWLTTAEENRPALVFMPEQFHQLHIRDQHKHRRTVWILEWRDVLWWSETSQFLSLITSALPGVSGLHEVRRKGNDSEKNTPRKYFYTQSRGEVKRDSKKENTHTNMFPTSHAFKTSSTPSFSWCELF